MSSEHTTTDDSTDDAPMPLEQLSRDQQEELITAWEDYQDSNDTTNVRRRGLLQAGAALLAGTAVGGGAYALSAEEVAAAANEVGQIGEPGSLVDVYAEDVDSVAIDTKQVVAAGVPVYDVTHSDYGAVGDGASDDRAAIQQAIKDAETTGGTVFLPQGDYLLDSTTNSSVALSVDSDNVTVTGAGRGATSLTLGDNVDGHVIQVSNVSQCSVTNLEIDGNKANQSSDVHGVRLESATACLLDQLHIHDTARYGVGAQSGAIVDNEFSSLLIENTGGDGIDVKNMSDSNARNFIDNVIVKSHGTNSSLPDQAGVDIRGFGWEVTNVHVAQFGSDSGKIGVRVRLDDANGAGGRFANLSNIKCEASTTTGTTGVVVRERSVSLNNLLCITCETGLQIEQREVNISNARLVGGTTGVSLAATGQTTDPVRCALSNITARSMSGTGIDIDTNSNTIFGFQIRGVDTGIDISGDNNVINSGTISDDTTATSDSGTNNSLLNIKEP